jgi:hypothetical protein
MGPEEPLPKTKEYWLKRAEETRAMAEQMHDAVSRDSLLSVAQSCEYLARFAPSEADLMGRLSHLTATQRPNRSD